MAWTTVLTDPEVFFHQEREDPGLMGPVVIVLAIGVLGVLSAVPGFYLIFENAPQEARPFVVAGLVIGILVALTFPFAIWLVYSLVFYAISSVFGGSGEFRDLFAFTGWGFLPRVLSAGISLVVAFVALLTVQSPESTQAVSQLQSPIASRPLVRATSVVAILLTLWSAYIWTYAVSMSRDLTLRQALATVSLPVVISISLSALRLLGISIL